MSITIEKLRKKVDEITAKTAKYNRILERVEREIVLLEHGNLKEKPIFLAVLSDGEIIIEYKDYFLINYRYLRAHQSYRHGKTIESAYIISEILDFYWWILDE